MKERTFRFYAKINNCQLIFNEKLPPGCVTAQTVTFHATRKNTDEIWLAKAINEHIEKMIEGSFHVDFEEIICKKT